MSVMFMPLAISIFTPGDVFVLSLNGSLICCSWHFVRYFSPAFFMFPSFCSEGYYQNYIITITITIIVSGSASDCIWQKLIDFEITLMVQC